MRPGRALAAVGLDALARGVLVPVMSLLALEKGLTLAQLAAGLALYSAAAFLLEVPSGVLADLLGRKRVFLLAQCSYAFALTLFWAARGTAPLYGALVLYGVAKALASGSMDALYIDTCLAAHAAGGLPRAAMRLNLWGTAGYAVGSLLGGGLNWAGQAFAGRGGGAVLPAALLLTLAALGAGASTREARPAGTKGEGAGPRRPMAALRRACAASPALPVLLGSTLFTGVVLALIETFWQPRFAALLPGERFSWLLGVLGFAYFAVSALGSVLAERLLARRSPRGVYLAFAGLFGLAVAALSLAGGPVLFAGAYLAAYLVFGVATTAQSVAINAAAPPEMRATLLSGQGFALQIGGFAGSLFASLSADRLGVPALWQWGAGLFLAGMALTGAVLRRTARKTE
ncbi:MFS transporter [Allofournierella sp.]|uniref:MFS transporter n=1 Tax=Allofournierella sp. TaxID=1940256 RepID=UPI003AB37DA4